MTCNIVMCKWNFFWLNHLIIWLCVCVCVWWCPCKGGTSNFFTNFINFINKYDSKIWRKHQIRHCEHAGSSFCVYLLLCAFLLGNLITFWHQHLLSLTKNDPSGLKVKYYENSELKLIRREMNQNPQLNRLPFWSDLEIQRSKNSEKRKRGW